MPFGASKLMPHILSLPSTRFVALRAQVSSFLKSLLGASVLSLVFANMQAMHGSVLLTRIVLSML